MWPNADYDDDFQRDEWELAHCMRAMVNAMERQRFSKEHSKEEHRERFSEEHSTQEHSKEEHKELVCCAVLDWIANYVGFHYLLWCIVST
jgi:hypothetical protein